MVVNITADNEQPVPKDALDTLAALVAGGADALLADLSRLLAKRLDTDSISVKLKSLRVIMVLASQVRGRCAPVRAVGLAAHQQRNVRSHETQPVSFQGGRPFAQVLRANVLPTMRAHTEFETALDPIHGEKPKLMVRSRWQGGSASLSQPLLAADPGCCRKVHAGAIIGGLLHS